MPFLSAWIFRKTRMCSNLAKFCPKLIPFKARLFLSTKVSAKEKKPKPCSRQTLPTIDAWDGMKISDIAKLTNRPVGSIIQSINAGLLGNLRVTSSSAIENRQFLTSLLSLLGFRPNFSSKKSKLPTFIDALPRPPPDPGICVPRPPVVTIMGHVDHGKTTLLDALRSSRLVDGEFGGITQHLSAFSLSVAEAVAASGSPLTLPLRTDADNGMITFIDTPGHAAFSAMRARGAKVTDIVLLVVAADDGVMPQTVESIRFAREADAQLLVAINKIDKYNVDVDRTIQGLAAHGVVVERLGGDVQAVEVSALKRLNLVALLEAIVAQSEVMQISADPTGPAEAVVLECRTELGLGKVSSCLVTRGRLQTGPKSGPLIAGESIGRVRVLRDDRGVRVSSVLPGNVAIIAGWKSLPHVGQVVLELNSEVEAETIARNRRQQRLSKKAEADQQAYENKMANYRSTYSAYLKQRMTMDRSSARRFAAEFRKNQVGLGILTNADNGGPSLPLILKTDVEGSLEAIRDLLATCPSDICRLQIAACGVGQLTSAEAELALAIGAEIFTFNVGALPDAQKVLDGNGCSIRSHNVIYRLADEVRSLMNAKLPPIYVEEVIVRFRRDLLATCPSDICRLQIAACGVGQLTSAEVELALAIGGEAVVLKTFEVTIVRGKRQEVIVAGGRCTKGSILARRSSRSGSTCVLFRVLRPNETLPQLPSQNQNQQQTVGSNDTSSHGLPTTHIEGATVLVDQAVCFSLRHGRKDVESVRRDVELGIILTHPVLRIDDPRELFAATNGGGDSTESPSGTIFEDFRPGDILQCYHIIEKPQSVEWQIDESH